MKPTAAHHHERFFPTYRHPLVSMVPAVALIYMVVVPVAIVGVASMVDKAWQGDGAGPLVWLMAGLLLVVPGTFFWLRARHESWFSFGSSVSAGAVSIRIPRGDRVVPLGDIARVELIDKRTFLADRAFSRLVHFRTLAGTVDHGALGRVWLNVAIDVRWGAVEPSMVRLVLTDDTSIVIDPLDPVGFVEALEATRASGVVPREPAAFPGVHDVSPEAMRFAMALVELAMCCVALGAFSTGIVGLAAGGGAPAVGGLVVSAMMGAVWIAHISAMPADDHVAHEVAVDETSLILRCYSGAQRFALRDVVNVEQLDYYDFWGDAWMVDRAGSVVVLPRRKLTVGRFDHPKYGKGYVNWGRRFPSELTPPVLALRLRNKALVVVHVDQPAVLEAALKQRLAALPPLPVVPVEAPE